MPIAARRTAFAYALQEVTAFVLERLSDLDMRNRDIAKPQPDVLGERVVTSAILRSLIVDLELLAGLQVVEYGHLAAADDRHLSDFVRIQPTDVDVRHGIVFEVHGQEHHIL